MGYIFESEIERIMLAVRARTIGEEECITLAKVLASDIHPAIKAYFRAEVHRMLQEERKSEVRSKKLPYAQPQVVRLQTQIDLLLMNYYEFTQPEFDTLLDHAVHFQFNYLCRPQWTLLGFMLENQRRTSANAILRKFEYCIDYIYFKEIIKRHIENHGLAEVTYEEFKSLLQTIDRAIVNQHSSLELARLTRPILGFVQAHQPYSEKKSPEEGATLPINAAIAFFEDKELNELKTRLEKERDLEGINDVSIVRLADLIEKVRTGNDDATVWAKPAATEVASREDLGLDEIRPEVEDAPQAEDINDAEPIDSVDPAAFDSDIDDESGMTDVESETIFAENGPGEEDGREAGDLEDVHSLFIKSEQKTFVRNIFHKDEVEFRNALDALNEIRSWKEASLYLDRIYVANNIDPFSKDAIRFTDKIQARYGSSSLETDIDAR